MAEIEAEVEETLAELRAQLIGKLARVVSKADSRETRGPIVVDRVEFYATRSAGLIFYMSNGREVWYFGANGWYVETIDGGRIYG